MGVQLKSAFCIGDYVDDNRIFKLSLDIVSRLRKEGIPFSQYVLINGLDIQLEGRLYTYVYYGYTDIERVDKRDIQSDYYQLVEYTVTDNGEYREIDRYNLFIVESYDNIGGGILFKLKTI